MLSVRKTASIALGGALIVAAFLASSGAVLAVAPSSGEPSLVLITQNPSVTPTFNPCATLVVVTVVSTQAPNCCATPAPIDAVVTQAPTQCPTPFQSIGGETATPVQTPPPTGTASDSNPGAPTPLFAVLIASLFGALGLAAAQMQRRSFKRR